MDRLDTLLPELRELEILIEALSGVARTTKLTTVMVKGEELPVYGISLGSQDPSVPVVGLFGGVHGLERIGSRVVLSYLRSIAELARWDTLTQSLLERVRIIAIPLVNPGGMLLQSRSNPRGVDLMRNAPVDAEQKLPWAIFRGHRFSNRLPWFRGNEGEPMEAEAKALCEFVRAEIGVSKVAVTLDVHSGYGAVDRLWFPYARALKPIKHIAELYQLKELLDRTYPNHIYQVEPQSKQYSTHGDLWDFLYDEAVAKETAQTYIPLSLEMGSWNWVKKNPRQMFTMLGAFNPVQRHRSRRILRRHLILIDFLVRAAISPQSWMANDPETRKAHWASAMKLWYEA